MNVTASKKPSIGGWMGAIWPPASVAIDEGWKFGASWFEHAVVDTPGSTLVRTFGKRPLVMNGVTLECIGVAMFHATPAPICDVPLFTWAVVDVSLIWKPTVLNPVTRKLRIVNAVPRRRLAARGLSPPSFRSGSPHSVML